MHIRMTTIRGDASKQQAAVDMAEGKGRAAIEATPGNKGFATMTGSDGTLIGASLWESAEAAAASEGQLSALRDEISSVVGGTVTVETYEVVAARRLSMPSPGAVVRVLRIEIDPAALDGAVTSYREKILPRILESPGLCSALLVLDRAAGRGVGISTWEDETAVEKAQHLLDELRAETTQSTGARFAPAEYYTMVRTTAQLD